MNTMLRPNAPQQTSLTPSSMSPGFQPAASGVHRGVWIGGGLMALTIVALATALVMRSGSGVETTAQLPPVVAPVVAPAPAPVATIAAPAPAPVADTTVAPAPVHRTTTVHRTAPRSNANTATNNEPAYYPPSNNAQTQAGNSGVSNAPPVQVASVPVCTSCGVVDSYNAVQVQADNNGVGAVAGGVGGAVLGSKIAGRNNHTLGGIVGAIGGGLLGNAVESHVRTTTVYDVHVRMNDGSTRTVRQATIPQVGERVSVDGNTIHAAPAQTSSNYGGGSNAAPSTNGGSTFSPTGS